MGFPETAGVLWAGAAGALGSGLGPGVAGAGALTPTWGMAVGLSGTCLVSGVLGFLTSFVRSTIVGRTGTGLDGGWMV